MLLTLALLIGCKPEPDESIADVAELSAYIDWNDRSDAPKIIQKAQGDDAYIQYKDWMALTQDDRNTVCLAIKSNLFRYPDLAEECHLPQESSPIKNTPKK